MLSPDFNLLTCCFQSLGLLWHQQREMSMPEPLHDVACQPPPIHRNLQRSKDAGVSRSTLQAPHVGCQPFGLITCQRGLMFTALEMYGRCLVANTTFFLGRVFGGCQAESTKEHHRDGVQKKTYKCSVSCWFLSQGQRKPGPCPLDCFPYTPIRFKWTPQGTPFGYCSK